MPAVERVDRAIDNLLPLAATLAFPLRKSKFKSKLDPEFELGAFLLPSLDWSELDIKRNPRPQGITLLPLDPILAIVHQL